MLHAAAMLIGLFVLGLLAVQRTDLAVAAPMAAVLAVACVIVTARFGGLGRSAFSAPQLWLISARGAGRVVRGAFSTLRASVAADVTLKPALVRVRSRTSRAFTMAMFADQLSAAPGAVVVDADADGLLVHVNDEDGIDAASLGELEARVISGLEGRA